MHFFKRCFFVSVSTLLSACIVTLFHYGHYNCSFYLLSYLLITYLLTVSQVIQLHYLHISHS